MAPAYHWKANPAGTIKCSGCNLLKPQHGFSDIQRAKVNKKQAVRCMRCIEFGAPVDQNRFMTCTHCNKKLPKESFAKTHRKNPDQARCNACQTENLHVTVALDRLEINQQIRTAPIPRIGQVSEDHHEDDPDDDKTTITNPFSASGFTDATVAIEHEDDQDLAQIDVMKHLPNLKELFKTAKYEDTESQDGDATETQSVAATMTTITSNKSHFTPAKSKMRVPSSTRSETSTNVSGPQPSSSVPKQKKKKPLKFQAFVPEAWAPQALPPSQTPIECGYARADVPLNPYDDDDVDF